MLAHSYSAKDEFELYGALVKDLSSGDFMGTVARIVVYKCNGNSWSLWQEFRPSTVEESGDYFQNMSKEYFAVGMDIGESTVTLQGRQLCGLVKIESDVIITQEFEDLCPDQGFKVYQQKELEQSIEFLKKMLSGD